MIYVRIYVPSPTKGNLGFITSLFPRVLAPHYSTGSRVGKLIYVSGHSPKASMTKWWNSKLDFFFTSLLHSNPSSISLTLNTQI